MKRRKILLQEKAFHKDKLSQFGIFEYCFAQPVILGQFRTFILRKLHPVQQIRISHAGHLPSEGSLSANVSQGIDRFQNAAG